MKPRGHLVRLTNTTDFVLSEFKVGDVGVAAAVGDFVEVAPAGGDEAEVAAGVFALGEFAHWSEATHERRAKRGVSESGHSTSVASEA